MNQERQKPDAVEIPEGATHYFSNSQVFRYHKIENDIDYYWDGFCWMESAFNEIDNLYDYIKPL